MSHFVPVLRSGQPMSAWTKMSGDKAIGREEALGVAGRLKALQVSLALPGGLVGVLGAIIEIPMLPMFHPWENFTLGGSVALELIGDDDARYVG